MCNHQKTTVSSRWFFGYVRSRLSCGKLQNAYLEEFAVIVAQQFLNLAAFLHLVSNIIKTAHLKYSLTIISMCHIFLQDCKLSNKT
jgi:hypothetical protein